MSPSIFRSAYPDLQEAPVSAEDLVTAIGWPFQTSFPFVAEELLFDSIPPWNEIEQQLDWVNQAEPNDERACIMDFPAPGNVKPGDVFYVFLQMGIFADGVISCEYQIGECVGENRYKLRNFWQDFRRDEFDHVRDLFRFVYEHAGLPPSLSTWAPVQEPLYAPDSNEVIQPNN